MDRLRNIILIFVIAGLALIWRLPRLELRPMHNDEAVNAIKFGDLWLDGNYKYDPDEYHGPTLHYFTLPFAAASGAKDFTELSEKTMRLSAVFFCVVSILMMWMLRGAFGVWGVFWGMVFACVSPMMVFYSRYFIHEMLLVCFTMMLIAGAWKYLEKPCTGWAIMAGAGAGLMYATKETFVLALFAIILAVIFELAWRFYVEKRGVETSCNCVIIQRFPLLAPFGGRLNCVHLVLAAGVGIALAFILFTSFFKNPAGINDSIKTYLPWFDRAGGKSPHIHPWYFYLERILWFNPPRSGVWSELPILFFGIIGGLFAFGKREVVGKGLARFFIFYTFILAVMYSAIPYKTPWCALGFWCGAIVVAGYGAGSLFAAFKENWQKGVVVLLVLAAVGQLSWMSWKCNFVQFADWRNPYVYSQTRPDILKMIETVAGISRVNPEGKKMVVKVVSPEHDYWPLPWYLRAFENVGWYDRLPSEPLPPVVIANSRAGIELDEKTNKEWLMVGLYEMRPRVFFELYVEFKWWEKYVMSLPKPKDE